MEAAHGEHETERATEEEARAGREEGGEEVTMTHDELREHVADHDADGTTYEHLADTHHDPLTGECDPVEHHRDAHEVAGFVCDEACREDDDADTAENETNGRAALAQMDRNSAEGVDTFARTSEDEADRRTDASREREAAARERDDDISGADDWLEAAYEDRTEGGDEC